MGRPLHCRSRQAGLSWSNSGWGCPSGCAVRGWFTQRGAARISMPLDGSRTGMAGQLRHRLRARLPALPCRAGYAGAERGEALARSGSHADRRTDDATGATGAILTGARRTRRRGGLARRVGYIRPINRRACCCWASISDMSFSSSFSICAVEGAEHACDEAVCDVRRAKHATCNALCAIMHCSGGRAKQARYPTLLLYSESLGALAHRHGPARAAPSADQSRARRRCGRASPPSPVQPSPVPAQMCARPSPVCLAARVQARSTEAT